LVSDVTLVMYIIIEITSCCLSVKKQRTRKSKMKRLNK